MTSDTRPKQIAVEFKLGGKTVRIGGMCKGAGMIQPGMSATGERPARCRMPACTPRCCVSSRPTPPSSQRPCKPRCNEAVAQSFNRITVDGDMSTNDTVLVLANGLAGNTQLTARQSSTLRIFQAALNHVCLELAKNNCARRRGRSSRL